MKQPQVAPRADLRAFRWQLHAQERRLEGDVQTACLEVARLQQRLALSEQGARRRRAEQRELQAQARQEAQHDLHSGARLVRYLARLEADLVAADAERGALERELLAARAACSERQRQLECVQALRSAAQRQHAQEQQRRESREADAAWLALVQQRRAATARAGRAMELAQRTRRGEGTP